MKTPTYISCPKCGDIQNPACHGNPQVRVPPGLPQVGHPVVFYSGGRLCSGTIAKWKPDPGPDAHSWIDGDWVATVTQCYTQVREGPREGIPDQEVLPFQITSFYSWANSLVGWWGVVEHDDRECRFYAMVPSHTFPHLPIKALMAPFLPPPDRRDPSLRHYTNAPVK